MTYRRAMDSAVAGSRGASQPAAECFPTPGTSRSASGAPLVQHPLERRQDQYACVTESNRAVPSFLTEDPTDSDNDSSDEVPCDANRPKTDDPADLQDMSSEAAPNGSAPETAMDASPTAGAAQAGQQ